MQHSPVNGPRLTAFLSSTGIGEAPEHFAQATHATITIPLFWNDTPAPGDHLMREMPKYLKKWLLIFLKQIPFFVKTIVIDSHLDGVTAPYGVLESRNVRMNMVQTVIRVLATGLDSKRPRIQSLTFRWNNILFNHHGYIVPRVNRRYYHLYWHFETKTFNRYPARVSYTEIKWK
jgi:hypothetical protein